MGPPLSTWPYSHSLPKNYSETSENNSENRNMRGRSSDNFINKCLVFRAVDNFRLICLNLTVVLVILQILFSLSSVAAGPVVLNLDYMQGPVPLARNIRHLPCISRRTAQEGLCMFAIDCLKANGTHLGTCIDRFYFGSCCQIPDKTILPQIIGNNIDDNSIDSSNFVHPQSEDKIQSTVSKIPNLFPTKGPTTEKVQETTTRRVETSQTAAEKYDTESPEMKTDDFTTLDNKIPDEDAIKVTTAMMIETTTKKLIVTKTTTKIPETTTEIPIKLSTFQTVSGDSNHVTEKPFKESQNATESTTIVTKTTTTQPIKLTSRKPTYKPRPSYKPSNFTRPTYSQTTKKPLPTKPISTIYNSTRKPPYRLPPKRPSTKKPLPSPPRLNITILPQSTSSRPVFTRPLTPIITYINNTATTAEEKPTSTSTLSTAPTSTITTTTTEKPTTSTEKPLTTTEKPLKTSEKPLSTSEKPSTAKLTTTTEKAETAPPTVTISSTSTSTSTQAIPESTEKLFLTTDAPINTVDTTHSVEPVNETTVSDEIVTEKQTMKPTEPEFNEMTEALSTQTTVLSSVEPSPTTTKTTPAPTLSTSTPFPPFVTWSNNGDSVTPVTKAPEILTTQTAEDETWSPITPPDGWILISTVPPKTDTTKTTTTTTPTTTEPTTATEQTAKPQATTIPETVAFPETETTQLATETIIHDTEFEQTEKATTNEPFTTEEQTTSPVVITTQPSSTSPSFPSTSSSLQPSSLPSTSFPSTSFPTTSFPATTEPSVMEFTVNVTMSPTVPDTTVAGLSNTSTFTTVSSVNVTAENGTESTTLAVNVTTVGSSEADHLTTASPINATSPTLTTPSFTTDEPVNMTDYKDVCGRRLWPQGRIVGGAKSGFGQWPWQISLRQYRTSTYLHKCGAALLNENWAITAAHCVEHVPPSELLVRLGEHDLANEDEPYGFAERRVQIVASHPHFDPATFEYDLALLRFYEPVTFQPNILPVCVPDTDEDFVGKTAYVTGWGRLYDEGPLPSVLQEVQVPVINNTACEAMYQSAGYNEHIPNIFICAGWRKGGSDSCEGDSGGPMVIQRDRDKRFVLSGVISWGIGCAEPNQPGVYTRISEFRDWINQILQF